jgi:hypothetical protein
MTDLNEFETYGYGASDTGDGFELQRCDEAALFEDDFRAAEACCRQALAGDRYAQGVITLLRMDCEKRDRRGRDGQPHDYILMGIYLADYKILTKGERA